MPSLALAQPILDDGTGTAHPDAIYIITDIHEDIIDGCGSLVWLPWHNAAALLAKEKGLSQCQVTQQLGKTDFALSSAYSVQAGAFSQAESEDLIFMAKSIKDTPAPPNADGSPATNPDGSPKLVSFFAGATVAQIG